MPGMTRPQMWSRIAMAALLRVIHERYVPNKVLPVAGGGAGQGQLQQMVPLIEGMGRRDGRATIYVCKKYACRLPTSDPAVAARLLDQQSAGAPRRATRQARVLL